MKKVILSLFIAGAGILVNAQEDETAVETLDVAKTESAQQDGTIVIEGDGKEESISLNGETLVVKGDNIVVHASGNAEKIVVEGNGCQIVVDETALIEINGTKSYVYYRNGEPQSKVSEGSAIQKIEG